MTVPTDPEVDERPLSEEQEKWLADATAQVDQDLLREIVTEMTAIPSPTGDEAALAHYLAGRGKLSGLEGEYQPIDDRQANAVLRRRGAGSGPDLLLYAPIDTHTSGEPGSDLPWVGEELREDMVADPWSEGPYVVGLGANNPKGHAACVVAAVEAISRADIPLRGSVIGGLGAGGMPTNPPPSDPRHGTGHGRGCAFMLEQGYRPDFAVIAKTGWAVAWEEVGISWIRVRVHGTFNYAGIRHFVDYRNPIVGMAKVVEGLERWFPEYSRTNTSGLVSPQGSIGAVEGGWTYKPTFVPSACDLYLDLRLSPRTTPADAKVQFGEAIDRIREENPELELDWEMTVAVPGTSTDPDAWIVQSCMRGWQRLEGRSHEPRANQSGATDANVLRGHGVPTARLGMARVPDDSPMPDDFSKGMNVVDLRDMEKLTHCLIYAAIDTCTRTREAVGLAV